jgi:hypothetical protein
MANKPDVTATPNRKRGAKFTSHFPVPSPCGGAVHGRDQSLQPLYCALLVLKHVGYDALEREVQANLIDWDFTRVW